MPFYKGHKTNLGKGWKWGECKEAREKIRKRMRGKVLSSTTRKKMSKSQVGKHSMKRPEYSGKKHYLWKADKATYTAYHTWLKIHFGKAYRCENSGCIYPKVNRRGKVYLKPKRFEWALIKGLKHSHDRKNYIMLCCSCHRKYDLSKK